MKNLGYLVIVCLLLGLVASISPCDPTYEQASVLSPAAPAAPEPVDHVFTGVGSQVTGAFQLSSGVAYVSARYRWTGQSENFMVRLEQLDGTFRRLVVNEMTLYMQPSPAVNTKQLVRVPAGRYLLQVQADQGNTWTVQIEQ